MIRKIILILAITLTVAACSPDLPTIQVTPDRESLIPDTQPKINPEDDIYPVKSETDLYDDPVPLPYPVNTAGAEDSAFIMPDGKTLFVWFTPDVKNPAQNQVTDGVTGIYIYHMINGSWTGPERVLLQDPSKAALDGCGFVLHNIMWFCTAREGLTGLHWFTAELKNGVWADWQLADFDPEYQVGELHITADGTELYFHSSRPGGVGGMDIWVSQNYEGDWGEPENIRIVNSAHIDGWPFISHDGTELWFTRVIGAPELWRSIKFDGEWTEPVKMFSIFSGEASMDVYGNVYFTHHYYKDDQMLEADIFVAYKR